MLGRRQKGAEESSEEQASGETFRLTSLNFNNFRLGLIGLQGGSEAERRRGGGGGGVAVLGHHATLTF